MSVNPPPVKVVYDLRVLPPTFDFLAYIAMVDGLRRIHAAQSGGMDLIIIRGDSLRGDEFANVASQEAVIAERVHTMLIPMTSLYPFIKTVTLIDVRLTGSNISFDHIFYPKDYSPGHPQLFKYYKNHMLYDVARKIDIRTISCPPNSLAMAQQLLKMRSGTERPVVFTLRNNALSKDQTRNTMATHLEIAERLARDFPVVVIPDTADVEHGVETDLPVMYEAALDVRIRAAAYEAAGANICGPTGPGTLMSLNKNVTYLQSDYAMSSYYNVEWFRKEGFEQGTNPFCENNAKQKIDFAPLTYAKAREFVEARLNDR